LVRTTTKINGSIASASHVAGRWKLQLISLKTLKFP